MSNNYSMNKIDEIIKLYREGKNFKEISEQVHFTPATVRKKLVAAGEVKKRMPLTDKDKSDIVRLYKEGKPINDIAAKYEKKRSTIVNLLGELGARKIEIYKDTLCIYCKYSAMGDISPCSWHRKDHRPRDDWTAVRRDTNSVAGDESESYRLLSCPGFERG